MIYIILCYTFLLRYVQLLHEAAKYSVNMLVLIHLLENEHPVLGPQGQSSAKSDNVLSLLCRLGNTINSWTLRDQSCANFRAV